MRYLAIALSLLPLVSCASLSNPPVTTEQFPLSYSTRDAKIMWRSSATPSGLKIDGVLKNRFELYLTDVELRGTLVDDAGNQIGRQASFMFLGQMAPRDVQAFTLHFPVGNSVRPSKVKFQVRYTIVEGKDSVIPFYQNFDGKLE